MTDYCSIHLMLLYSKVKREAPNSETDKTFQTLTIFKNFNQLEKSSLP